MRLKLDFEEISNVMGYVNTVLSDKSVDEKMKNVIFMVAPEDQVVRVIAYNALTFSRTVLEKVEVFDIPESGWQFQIKASELNKILSSFSNMYKTHVKDLDVEDYGVRIRVVIHEVPNDENDAKLEKDSVFELENAPILANIEKEVKTEFPEERNMVVGDDIMLYINSMFGIMSNDSSNTIASKINFAEDYVFCISSTMSAFFKNQLPAEFRGVSLGYSSIGFLKKVCESGGDGNISVAKTDVYLCVESGNTQAFMRYKPIKISYKAYIQKKTKDLGIVVDRLYFKDVLKRMGIISVDGRMMIENGENVVVQNEFFNQEIPLNGIKEGTVGLKFKFSVPVIEKLILGNDEVFSGDLFIYFVETMRGYIMYIQDATDVWFANTQVTRV